MSLALFYAMPTGDAVAPTHCHARCTCGCPLLLKQHFELIKVIFSIMKIMPF